MLSDPTLFLIVSVYWYFLLTVGLLVSCLFYYVSLTHDLTILEDVFVITVPVSVLAIVTTMILQISAP